MAGSTAIYSSLPGNFSLMNLDSALEIGIIPSAIIDSILGRMTSTAASLIASCAVLIKSKPATIPHNGTHQRTNNRHFPENSEFLL